MTNLLAVETSGIKGSLALLQDGVVAEERSLAVEGRRNAQTLVSEAAGLLKDHDLKPADVSAVAVSFGPGSFTGLRVGITFAKTFCWANDSKLIAVDTHRALAHRVDHAEQLVTVVSDAQRGELFVSEYSIDEKNRRRSNHERSANRDGGRADRPIDKNRGNRHRSGFGEAYGRYLKVPANNASGTLATIRGCNRRNGLPTISGPRFRRHVRAGTALHPPQLRRRKSKLVISPGYAVYLNAQA